MSRRRAVLMVVTNHDRIDAGHATGVWFEEFAIPYCRFTERDLDVVVGSPRGGPAPVDPNSLPAQPDDPPLAAAMGALQVTRPLADIDPDPFDAVFFAGGHGAMYDFPRDPVVAGIVGRTLEEERILALVCHGPAALLAARRADGRPAVRGRRITAFSDAEENAVNLTTRVPFLLESRLRALGAEVDTRPPWHDHVVVDGHLVTGQNPQSSASTAVTVIRLLSESG